MIEKWLILHVLPETRLRLPSLSLRALLRCSCEGRFLVVVVLPSGCGPENVAGQQSIAGSATAATASRQTSPCKFQPALPQTRLRSQWHRVSQRRERQARQAATASL